MIPVIKC